jgi:DNA-binding MarR family transcriptional regulator
VNDELKPAVAVLPRDLARTAAWLSKQLELALTAAELTPPQYRVLVFLDEGSAESSALARGLAVRPPSVTSVMDGLVSRGLVERSHCEGDRRRVRHVLTDDGRGVLRRADESVGNRLNLIASALDDETQVAQAVSGLVMWRPAMAAYRQRSVRP